MPLSMSAIQTEIYEALVAAGVAEGRVYDEAPDDVGFPYVEIGEAVDTAADCDGFVGVEEFLTAHVWSREGGQREAEVIMDAIRAVLHQTRLTDLEDDPLVWVTDARMVKQPDGRTYQGVMRIKIAAYAAA